MQPLYLRGSRGVWPRILLAGVLVLTWSLATLKIITEPLSPVFALFYGIPLGLIQSLPYLLWDRFKERSIALWIFPALMAAAEWAQFSLTPLGSWGAAAYTQLENLPLLQLASLFGLPGIAYIINLVPALLERRLSGGGSRKEAAAWAPSSSLWRMNARGVLACAST